MSVKALLNLESSWIPDPELFRYLSVTIHKTGLLTL